MSPGQLFSNHFKGIIDSTLREGLQSAELDLPGEEQLAVLRMLYLIGADRVEVGNPVNEDLFTVIRKLTEVTDRPLILAHIRNHERDYASAREARIDGVNILCTADEDRIAYMNLTLESYRERMLRLIQRAKAEGVEVRVSIEDFFNRPTAYAFALLDAADDLGVDRVGVADTLGNAMEWQVRELIGKLRRRLHADIEVHFHNDLGQATSNALTAVQAGANWVDVTLLGLGERTGITPLCTFLSSLYVIDPKLTSGYQLEQIAPAEEALSEMLEIAHPFNLITNPRTGFSHKAGIHLDAIGKFGPSKYELFSPSLIGHRGRQLVTGSVISGKTSDYDAEMIKEKYRLI